MSQAYAADPMADEPPETGAPEPQEAETAQPKGGKLAKYIDAKNIADDLEDSVLAAMGQKVVEEFGIDLTSREATGWDDRNTAAMSLALQVKEQKNTPWPNASNVKYPLLSQAIIQFNARSYSALVDGFEIVKGKVMGQVTPEKQDRADRIAHHMSYQFMEEMAGWEADTDRLLMMVPLLGCAFRKTFFDPIKQRNDSVIVAPKDFVVNYMTQELDDCPRATHVLTFYPHQIAEKMNGGIWLKKELGRTSDASNDDQAPHTFLEQYRLWDLDGDDYPEPYIITVHKETQIVVRVVARYDEDGLEYDGKTLLRIVPTKVFTKYPFIPSPDGSFYELGFGTLLGALTDTINTTINQMMDAGTLANRQAGFIGAGVSIKSGVQGFRPGEFKKVDVAGVSLKDNVVLLPTKEPSAVLFQLLEMLIAASKDLTATQDILSGDTGKANQPVGTTLAVIEQGLKTFTAIVKRLHRALKHEMGVIYDLNARYLDPQVYFNFQDTPGVIAQQDYKEGDCDVVPVSDPSMATDMQKLGRAQFLMQFLGKGLDDMAIIQRVLESASITDIKDLMPKGPPPPNPKLAIEADKMDIAHRKEDTAAAVAHSTIAVNEANAQATMMQTFMAGPQFQQMVAQFIDARVQEQLTGAGAQQPQGHLPNGGSVAGPPQPGPVGGLAPGPEHPQVPPVPPGPAPGPDGGVGFHGGPEHPAPGQGAPVLGAG